VLQPQTLAERRQRSFDFGLSDELGVEIGARPLPAGGWFSDEDAMKIWFASTERVVLRALTPSQAAAGLADILGREPRCLTLRECLALLYAPHPRRSA
jgi:hypothetical protein